MSIPSSRRTLALALMVPALGWFGQGCGPREGADDVAAIKQVMHEQEVAWDGGDIPGFMAGYDETICFISPSNTICGREPVTARYLRSYPDKAAMGDLEFGIGEVVLTGPEHAWCTGTWKLYRATDTVGGGFSLLWKRTPHGWRILRDHTY